ncbi:electron transport complex protein RnfE [Modicisalibacter ilicicola DSM 19980]|uniref:Ion-translocating oxidoreductase complex subunit E n=1 Tax=Modicisalibacter ilicicola DSM 19980 TaxID=1121942 RepID=A0A1M4ZAZ7_9GAMM|nr:electron transport complex subunit E [Halomonas ilicicola]SHF15211.1 electron transport complex protein RnfE [Halomonas ilicicola DSM 19980]
MSQFNELTRSGLWSNNPALVQLLGLCPLLAVTSTVVNALGLGLATLLVMIGANVSVSLIRHHVPANVRLPAFVMIIAAFVTCAELLMQAYTFRLYQILGIFIPLIVTNCAILGRADGFAAKNPLLPAATDGLMMGLGFAAVLVVLGAVRELFGQGTLFAGMELLLGPMAADWQITLFSDYSFLFLVLPPGAFFATGLLIAAKNVIDDRLERRRQARQADRPKESRRVRVTGTIR